MPWEYKGQISPEKQLAVSQFGLEKILNILKKHQAKATFFSTVVFAENSKYLINRLIEDGHELASHTWYHSNFNENHLVESRVKLSEMFGVEISGLRMPRMMKISSELVKTAGYQYNSSINPTFLPGRYNNVKVSRTHFRENGLLQFPASVSPNFRIPLFWLSFHNFPLKLYKKLAADVLAKDGYLNIYFHPWEFSEITDTKYNLPKFTTKNTGKKMEERFENFLLWLKNRGEETLTFSEFINRNSL